MFALVWPSLSEQPSTTSTPTPFSPFDIPWLFAAWADDPDWTDPGDGNPVDTWRDGSGNSRDATSSSTERPLFTSSLAALNNRGTLTFDGSNDNMATPTFTLTATYSLVAIASFNSSAGGDRFVMTTAYNADGIFARASTWSSYVGTYVDSGVARTTPGFLYAVYHSSATQSLMRVNNTSVSGGNFAGSPTNGVKLGGYGTSFNLGCDIAFAAAYSGILTDDAAWPDFVDWMNDYYGLSVTA
jgi:hypothetical protein